ncbi:glutathione synthetase, ATP-grasp domain [Pelomyxa schiedti]|nr:glutathione synthetase, ATP-grasp domain [Pelomyxa schiedti]
MMGVVGIASSGELLGHNENVSLQQSLMKLGCRSQVVDWQNPEVNWASFDCVIVRTTWNYSWHLEEFLAWAKRVSQVTKLFNTYETLLWNSTKTYLRELEEEGISVVPTVWAEKGSRTVLSEVMSTKGWNRVIVKPTVSAGSRNTHRIPSDCSTEQDFSNLVAERDMMVQPYIDAVESRGELSLLFFGGKHSHTFWKIPKPGDFRAHPKYGGTFTYEPNTPPEAMAMAHRILAAANRILIKKYSLSPLLSPQLTFYARIDFLVIPNNNADMSSPSSSCSSSSSSSFALSELEVCEPNFYSEQYPPCADNVASALLSIMGHSGP